MFLIVATISYLWVSAIDNMRRNYPDYKGEDFLNWDLEETKKETKLPDWDDNTVHTEGKFN